MSRGVFAAPPVSSRLKRNVIKNSAKYGNADPIRTRRNRYYQSGIAEWAVADETTRMQLVESCKELYRSNSIMQRIIHADIENIVADGFKTIPTSADPGWNRAVRDRLKERYKAQNFSVSGLRGEWETLQTVCAGHSREGGVFVYRSSHGVQLFEEGQVFTPYDKLNDSSVKQGFVFNSKGQATHIYVGNYRALDGIVDSSRMKKIPIWMDDKRLGIRIPVVSYIRANTFASGLRGIPIMASAIDDLERFNDFQDAITERAVIESCVMGVMYSSDTNVTDAFKVGRSDDGTTTTQSVTYDDVGSLEQGTILKLKKDVDEFKIEGLTTPGNNYDSFTKMNLRIICAAASMPIEIGLMLFSDTNFAAAKAAIKQYQQRCRMTKKYYAEEYCFNNYLTAVYEDMRDGIIPFRSDWQNAVICPSGWEGLENKKDSEASLVRVKGNISSESYELALMGREYEDVVREKLDQADVIERVAKERGISVEDAMQKLGIFNQQPEAENPNQKDDDDEEDEK